jgi:ABC-type uncharacterized transport system auxiliary subunit
MPATATQAPAIGSAYGQAPALATAPSPATTFATTSTDVAVPQVADDSDLIEKEWVDKAKLIVQANINNPYEQSRELTSLKAEYMKKRYNKDIRLGE